MMNSNSLLSTVQINCFSLLCFLLHLGIFKEISKQIFNSGIILMRIGKCCLLLLNAAMLPNEYCFLFPFMSPETTGTNKEIGKMKDSFV